jgi:LEA14-like dessication related protein
MNRILNATIFGLLVVFALLNTGCNIYKDVELTSVEDVSIEEFNSSGIRVKADLKIENPNAYKVKLTAADLDMKANGRQVGKTLLHQSLSIPRKSHGVHSVYFVVKQDQMSLDLLSQVFIIALTGKATIEINGYVKGRGLGVGVKVPVEHKEVVEL